MDYYGYAGRILHVDLNSGRAEVENASTPLYNDFIGGWGANYRLIWDHLKAGTDPMSPENPIIIGAGPLCGTLAPQSGKCAATMKLPNPASKNSNKHVVAASMAGTERFGVMLKNAGYDHLIIKGRANVPSYLKIINDAVEICDARDLWGKKDVYETTEELWRRHRGATGKPGVYAIGRAGENRVLWSMPIVDKSHTMGRGGGAAVMASKNLKAVVVLGTRGIKIADKKRFMKLVEKKRSEMMNHPAFGSSYPGGGGATSADYPEDLFERIRVTVPVCMGCLDPCKVGVQVQDGRFKGLVLEGGSFNIIRDYGRRLRIRDYGDMVKLMDTINRFGLCMLTALRMLYFMTRIYERGLISQKDTGGLELKRGDFEAYLRLLEKIVDRKDIGNHMADGWYALSKAIGIDAESETADGCAIVKGNDTIIDARLGVGVTPYSLSQVMRPKPLQVPQAAFLPKSDNIYADTAWPEWQRTFNDLKKNALKTGASEEEINRIFTSSDFNIGRLQKHQEDAHAVENCLGVCPLPYWLWQPMHDIPLLSDFYSAATGMHKTAGELKLAGERSWNMERLVNVREGFTRKDDKIPEVWLKNIDVPIKLRSGDIYLSDWFNRRVTREQISKTLDDYFDERGWDLKTGIPTEQKLHDLKLSQLL
jgi:aldehyde:ferredoxin oxidoreductase